MQKAGFLITRLNVSVSGHGILRPNHDESYKSGVLFMYIINYPMKMHHAARDHSKSQSKLTTVVLVVVVVWGGGGGGINNSTIEQQNCRSITHGNSFSYFRKVPLCVYMYAEIVIMLTFQFRTLRPVEIILFWTIRSKI